MQIVLWILIFIYFLAGHIYAQTERKKFKVDKSVSTDWSFNARYDGIDFILCVVGILITAGLIFVSDGLISTIIAWVLFAMMLFQFAVALRSLSKPKKSVKLAEELFDRKPVKKTIYASPSRPISDEALRNTGAYRELTNMRDTIDRNKR